MGFFLSRGALCSQPEDAQSVFFLGPGAELAVGEALGVVCTVFVPCHS